MQIDESRTSKIKRKTKDELDVEMMFHRETVEKSCKAKALAKRMEIERKEYILEQKILHADDHDNLKREQIKQTQKLAKELLRRKNEERQKYLKATQANAIERSPSHCAIEETRSQLLRDKICLEARQAEALRNWYENDDVENKERMQAEERKRNYRKDLEDQLIVHRRKMREEAEEKQRERKVLENTAVVIKDEEVEKERRKKELIENLRAEKNSFLEARQKWKDKRLRTLEEEHVKIGKIIIEKETEHKKMAEKVTDTRGIKDAIVDKIARKIVNERCRKQEREDVCSELYRQEELSEWANEPKKAALKKERIQKEILDQMVRDNVANAERKAKEDAVDAAFSRYLDEERERLDRIEKEKVEKRRKKNVQYGKDLLDTIQGNRVRYATGILRRQLEIGLNTKNTKQVENNSDNACINRNIVNHNDNMETGRVAIISNSGPSVIH